MVRIGLAVVVLALGCGIVRAEDLLIVECHGLDSVMSFFDASMAGDVQLDYWYDGHWWPMVVEHEAGDLKVFSSGPGEWSGSRVDRVWYRVRFDGWVRGVLCVVDFEAGGGPWTHQIYDNRVVKFWNGGSPINVDAWLWGPSHIPCKRFRYVAASFVPAAWWGLGAAIAVGMTLWVAVGWFGRVLREAGAMV